MKSWKRMLFYLILNAFVSICATLTVLVLWDQFRGPLPKGLLPTAVSRFSSTETTGTPAAPASTAASQPTPTEQFLIYQVQAGDTFDSIAAQYNVSIEELLAKNGFTRVQQLGTGEVLRIPVNPQGSVLIDSVVGAGDLDTEHILLKHRGNGELSLVGWRIEDGKGNVFIFPQFPQLVLFPGGAVNVYTKSGNNSVVDMFWGLDKFIWASGMTVTLKDAMGNVRASYPIP